MSLKPIFLKADNVAVQMSGGKLFHAAGPADAECSVGETSIENRCHHCAHAAIRFPVLTFHTVSGVNRLFT